MTTENVNQGSEQPTGQQPATNIPVEQTPVEWAASQAYTRSGEAADALRRGELMQNSTVDPLADSDDRLIALLSYVTQLLIPVVMPLIVLLSESSKKRPFQRYHAVQSLAFAVLFLGIMISIYIGATIVLIVPFIGGLIAFMIYCLTVPMWVGGAVLTIYYGFQAYAGKRFAIPGLTSFLRDQGWV